MQSLPGFRINTQGSEARGLFFTSGLGQADEYIKGSAGPFLQARCQPETEFFYPESIHSLLNFYPTLLRPFLYKLRQVEEPEPPL